MVCGLVGWSTGHYTTESIPKRCVKTLITRLSLMEYQLCTV